MSTQRFKCVAAAGLMAAVGVVSQVAHAQAFDAVRLSGEPGAGDEGRVGLAVVSGRQYMGSDERRTLVVPTLDYRWANGWFAGITNGVGYRFSSDPQFQYGLRLTGDFGRGENRSDALRGLGDIPARAELGAFFNVQASRQLTFTSSLRYGAGEDHKGLLLDLGAHYGTLIAPQWLWGAGLSATYANRNYTQGYFGITPQQASRSGYAVYEAGAGVRDVRLGSSLTYLINREWAATFALNASSLQGDAKDSPIVRSRSTVNGVFAVGYRF